MCDTKGVMMMDVDTKDDEGTSDVSLKKGFEAATTERKQNESVDEPKSLWEEQQEATVIEAKETLKRADEVAKTNLNAALALYKKLREMDDKDSDKVKKLKGIGIVRSGKVLAELGKSDAVLQLTKNARTFFRTIPKARTAKIVRDLLVAVSKVPGTIDLQEKLCVDSIEWCKQQKRNFLRQRLETRYASIMLQLQKYDEAMALLRRLQREVKKVDDKQLLLEINLVESRVQYRLQNMPKAKAALTAARTNANSIYVQQYIQAEIDHQAGVLQSEERDYKTAYSYFFEAFEARNALKQREEAKQNLKYMLMSKIMMDKPHEVASTIGNKNMLVYAGRGIDAMVAVAAAYKRRSLHDLEDVLEKYKDELASDELIQHHLKDLTERLLEANLCRIIEPYSRVQIAHVASRIKLPIERVERKLSQMILDEKFHGILNQGKGELLVREPRKDDEAFSNGLKVIKNMGGVVEGLFRRAERIASA